VAMTGHEYSCIYESVASLAGTTHARGI
jgi:hypothetical protein